MAVAGAILLGIMAFRPNASPSALGLNENSNSLLAPTNASVALTTNTSTLVLAASSGRLYAYICSVPTNTTSTFLTDSNARNASGTTVGVPATVNSGIYLAAGTCYSISGGNLLVGQVNAYANASNTLSLIYQ